MDCLGFRRGQEGHGIFQLIYQLVVCFTKRKASENTALFLVARYTTLNGLRRHPLHYTTSEADTNFKNIDTAGLKQSKGSSAFLFRTSLEAIVISLVVIGDALGQLIHARSSGTVVMSIQVAVTKSRALTGARANCNMKV